MEFIKKMVYWVNCHLGEHRPVPAKLSYNTNNHLYYPVQYICLDCGKLFKQFGL